MGYVQIAFDEFGDTKSEITEASISVEFDEIGGVIAYRVYVKSSNIFQVFESRIYSEADDFYERLINRVSNSD